MFTCSELNLQFFFARRSPHGRRQTKSLKWSCKKMKKKGKVSDPPPPRTHTQQSCSDYTMFLFFYKFLIFCGHLYSLLRSMSFHVAHMSQLMCDWSFSFRIGANVQNVAGTHEADIFENQSRSWDFCWCPDTDEISIFNFVNSRDKTYCLIFEVEIKVSSILGNYVPNFACIC